MIGHCPDDGVRTADRQLPEVREGDVLAFLSAGGYGASMASRHCARPPAAELVVAVC